MPSRLPKRRARPKPSADKTYNRRMTARPAIFSDVSLFPRDAKPLASYRKYWAQRYGIAKFLPTTRAEMEALGWDSCDIILVTGDAYVDHPSFGMAVIGRMLEVQGFRVGIIEIGRASCRERVLVAV